MAGAADNNQEGIVKETVRQFVDASLRGEKPDLDEFVKQYPKLESQIRKGIQELHKINNLFDSLVQADEVEFAETVTGQDLVGRKIGSFEIEEMIGRGGMGVVYLARDTKLKRSVAIKSMPVELQADSTARTRFRREAELLASLNHPNIAIIHEIIEQEEGASYLVLEYVPGETLAQRIAQKPLKLEEALSIGQQVAEAVSAAHDKGVIHRDLKPGNIKITPEGKVKVLDFGLAKVSSTEGQSIETAVTQPGRVIGTPAYMSPEQACGKPTDKRSDIWSFGCLMYEMLSGHPPFESETATEILARIIEREPDWDVLPKDTPMNIRVLIRRCLEKDLRRRLRDIGDASIEIDETLNLPAAAPPVSAPVLGKPRSVLWRLAIACSVVGIAVGLIAASMFLSKRGGPSYSTVAGVPTWRSVIPLPDNQTLALSRSQPLGIVQPAVALSADGSRLVYVGDLGGTIQLFLRLMNQLEVRAIPGTKDAVAPFFSPDGQSVGFFSKGKLKIVSLLGGEPVALCDARNPKGGSWGADGMIYFAEKEGDRLSRVPATGGATEHLKAIAEPSEQGVYGYGHPQILPGGKEILLSSRTSTILFSLETREKEILVKGGQHARYVPTGHLVYARAGAIEAVRFDLATLQVTGPSVPILDRVLMHSSVGTAQLVFSSDGLLVYVPGGDRAKSTPVWVDRQGNVEPLAMPAQIYGTPKISPDGKRLAILIRGPPRNVYIYDIASGRETRLTLEGNNYAPVWTPDGKRITFCSDRQGEGTCSLFWKPADGSGEAELLRTRQYAFGPTSWSADGKLLAFDQGGDIWVLSLEGGREPELVIGTEFFEWGPAFSPDGRWIAYISDKDGKFQVYVQPYPAMDRVWQVSDDFGGEPIWSPKGDELFYRNGDKWMVVSISTKPEFSPGTPRLLFEGPYNNVPGVSYDVAPDAQRFLALQPEYDDSQVRELQVVTNWFEELKRLVPPRKE